MVNLKVFVNKTCFKQYTISEIKGVNSKIEMSWSKFPQQVSIDAPRAVNSHIHPGQQQNVRSPFLNTTNQLRPFKCLPGKLLLIGTPNPWVTLLLVLGKNHVNQILC